MASVVHIVLRDDDPAGVVLGTRDNWTGRALAFPVAELERVRTELDVAGVYVLVGADEDAADGAPIAYIGEAESIADRIRPPHSHLGRADVTWQRIIAFSSQADDLHKAHVKWLESALVARARQASRWKLTNGPAPSAPRLPEFDQVFVETFFNNMVALYPLLGVDAFELGAPAAPVMTTPAGPAVGLSGDPGDLTLLRGGAVIARSRLSRGGLTILSGSRVARGGTGSEGPNVARLRALLEANGRLQPVDDQWFVLDGDYEVNSASAAAKLVAGSSVSGLKEWRTPAGKPLGQFAGPGS